MKAEPFTTPVQPHPFGDPITPPEDLAELGSGEQFPNLVVSRPQMQGRRERLEHGRQSWWMSLHCWSFFFFLPFLS